MTTPTPLLYHIKQKAFPQETLVPGHLEEVVQCAEKAFILCQYVQNILMNLVNQELLL